MKLRDIQPRRVKAIFIRSAPKLGPWPPYPWKLPRQAADDIDRAFPKFSSKPHWRCQQCGATALSWGLADSFKFCVPCAYEQERQKSASRRDPRPKPWWEWTRWELRQRGLTGDEDEAFMELFYGED